VGDEHTHHTPSAYASQPTNSQKGKNMTDYRRTRHQRQDMGLVHTLAQVLHKRPRTLYCKLLIFRAIPSFHTSIHMNIHTLSTTLWPSSLFSRRMGCCIGVQSWDWIGFGGYSHTAAGHPATDRLEVPSRYRPELEKPVAAP
jgi:hypothetical protein